MASQGMIGKQILSIKKCDQKIWWMCKKALRGEGFLVFEYAKIEKKNSIPN